MKTQESIASGTRHRDSRDSTVNLVRIQKHINRLVGEENVLPSNVSSFSRDRQARALEQVVELIRPALPLLVFRPPIELIIENPEDADISGRRHEDWDLKCIILGPKFLSGEGSTSSLSADLVLGEDGRLYAIDWTGAWSRTHEGGIAYRATVRRYETFEDAFNDGWGPVEHYIEQIENRLDAAL